MCVCAPACQKMPESKVKEMASKGFAEERRDTGGIIPFLFLLLFLIGQVVLKVKKIASDKGC